jgi:hypothetical protein
MDNETTIPAVLTQPGQLSAPRTSEPINPVYLIIFIVSLLVVAALVYFV